MVLKWTKGTNEMITRKGTKRDPALWDRWVNDKYEGKRIVLSPEESIIAARKLYRHAMGKTWTGEVRITSGNRYTWVRRGVLCVNPNYRGGGLRQLIHLLSHYCHYRLHPDDAPHSIRQARIERNMVDFALKRGWHEGALKAAVPAPKEKPKPDVIQQRYARMVTRRDKWGKEIERARRLHDKARREVREYERRHKERLGL